MQVSQINNNYNSSFHALYLRNSGNWGLSKKVRFERHPEVCQLIRLFRMWDMDLEAKLSDSLEREIEISAINNENIKDNNFVCKIQSLKDFCALKTFNEFMNKLSDKDIKCLLNRTTT